MTRYFNCIDQAAKGFFVMADVDAIAIRMAERRNIEQGSNVYLQIREGVRALWHNSRLYGFSQDPDQVTLADWIAHETYVLSTVLMREAYMKKLTREVFDAVDQGYGTMDVQQYTDLMIAFGVEPDTTEWAFSRLDVAQKGYLTRDEFVRLVEQFHMSEDRDAPGNYLFGVY
ncbi:MAG: hypothetical protein WD037_07620 [Balneolales bacterium]